MLKPGPLPRGTCQRCGKRVALRKNGVTREHSALYYRARELGALMRRQRYSDLCLGSGQRPKETPR